MRFLATAARMNPLKCPTGIRRLLWVAPWVLSACAPTIRQFEVTPHAVCPGTPVAITWKVRGGSAKLTTVPPLRSQSNETYIPATTTRFILTVEPFLGEPKSRETEATVYTPIPDEPLTSEIAFTPPCQRDRIVAKAERPFEEWDPRLTVGRVETSEARDLTLSHEGRQATLTARESGTETFDGTQLAGTWTLEIPLLPNERCDEPGNLPPDLFIVTAHLRCGD